MQKIPLNVKPRDLGEKDKLTLNQLRKQGWIPAIVYGHGKPLQIAVDRKSFSKAVHTDAGVNALFNVTLDGKVDLSIIKEVQRDIFTQEPIHVDFMRISLKEKIDISIPIHLQGEPVGVKEHEGILEHMLREIRLRCLPNKIPPHVDVDVSQLDLHDHVKVADLKLEEGIEIITETDQLIAHVVVPRVEEEPAPAPEAVEGEVPAEPEVIAKGKKEEEEGAEGEAKPATKGKPEAKKEEAKK